MRTLYQKIQVHFVYRTQIYNVNVVNTFYDYLFMVYLNKDKASLYIT